MRTVLTGGVLLLALATKGVPAAPLFPDVPDGHWARDAVAALAARGLVEGYPDGTFKGDRASSRWEVALVVARLLARMEAEHATFATRAELEEVRKLAAALRSELEALGLRVTNLEENVGRLDGRVTELERITFYGRVEAMVVGQAFYNRGVGNNNGLGSGPGVPGGVPFRNYNSLVGSAAAPILRPQQDGIVPVVDYRNGRALTTGSGFTMVGVLGVNAKLTTDLTAGLELAAFTSQGDQFVDSYWGVSAPYLSNPFTTLTPLGGAQPLNNQPFTRMTLDRFWMEHAPSKTRVVLGTFEKLRIDPHIYAGQPNLGVYGPKRFPGFGFQVQGQVDVAEAQTVKWEAFGTRFGHALGYDGSTYQPFVLGGDIAYEFEAGHVRLDFARMAEEAPAGGPLVAGLLRGLDVPYAASSGYTVRQWVNPPGYFAAQQATAPVVGGRFVPNTVDTRPISGWNGNADNAINVTAGGGNFGPQEQNGYGLSASYRWLLGEDSQDCLRLAGDFGHSRYRSNRNSGYTADGNMYRIELGAALLEETLNLDVAYLSVDPDYNPASWLGAQLGVRFPRSADYTGAFHLHDHGLYPHNREGVRLGARWAFDEKRGELWARAAFLNQRRTSLYDVRVTGGALGPGVPTNDVIGYAPGFVDYIFAGFAHPAIYGPLSRNSFTGSLAPLENPRGTQRFYGGGVSYRFADPRLRLTAGYEHNAWLRNSALTPAQGGSQNRIDLRSDYLNLGLSWDADEMWTVNSGLERVSTRGHLDPGGRYNAFALSTGSTTFDNLNSVQTIPSLGFDCRLSATTEINVTGRYYFTDDNVPQSVAAGAGPGTVGTTAHPFSWDGWQLSSHFLVKF